MTLSEELTQRGLVNQTTLKDLSVLDQKSLTFYWGVDPSADSMTVGNLAAAMMVKLFMKHGHRAVLLIGGATGMIGDPDGKAEERQLLSLEQINHNKQALENQYKTIFQDFNFSIVDNFSWFKDFKYLDFLRDIGKHVPMRQMLNREFVDSRLALDGNGLSYAEFSYALIQAYDFLYLMQNYGVSLQLAGADQWGNSIAGVDLIRRKTAKEAHVYSCPLIIDEATGRKFGKSENGAIWLDPNKTSPTSFYQFWINQSDAAVAKYLKIFTELPLEQIDELMQRHKQQPEQRLAQAELARQTTQLVHGSKAMHMAESITDILTGQMSLENLDDASLIKGLGQEVSHIKVAQNSQLAEVLVEAKLAQSKTEARQLIGNGAISLNGVKTQKNQLEPSDFIKGRLLIRRGKAYKDTALVEIAS
jgi:tyrosyl-tRNA synthetase